MKEKIHGADAGEAPEPSRAASYQLDFVTRE
jgi:hypothetical protein